MSGSVHWDVVVIGTGMGGATAGFRLAKAGRRVLFIEKGRSHLADSTSFEGAFAETFFQHSEAPSRRHRAVLRRAGRSSDTIYDRSAKRERAYVPFIGSGTGGSTALYGAALERMTRRDFEGSPGQRGQSRARRWPVSYEQMLAYYREAERHYGVRGGRDPLSPEPKEPLEPAPAVSEVSKELMEHFERQGLHPYTLPVASRRVEGCDGCQGYLCAKGCKNDSARVSLVPALEQYGAHLMDECRVVRLEADSHRVTGIVCERYGTEFTLTADTVVLAAGALQTPCVLLRSISTHWPDGLGNTSSWVGRGLMRHFVDLYAVQPRTTEGLGTGFKELALNDLYEIEGEKFGTLQSFGALPPADVIGAGLQEELRQGPVPWAAALFGLVKPIACRALAHKFSRSVLLASIMEDFSYFENRVFPHSDGDDVVLEYRIRSEDKARIERFRKKVAQVLRPYSFTRIKQAENNERIAHVCGTCRMGDDPNTSVVNADGRVHGVDNLYIVDASVFPSSSGTNPGLTIAANAMRSADLVLTRQRNRTSESVMRAASATRVANPEQDYEERTA